MTTLLSPVDRGLDPQDPSTLIRELTQKARHHGPTAWLVLLANQKTWNALPSFVQDQVAAALCQVLGPGWSSEGASEFSAPALSQRIHCIRYSPLSAAPRDQGTIHWQFAIIPGGVFSMGYRHSPISRMTHVEASPQRKVSIAPFLLGRSPVTQEMWDQVGGKDEREWREPALPIERVSWSDARDWLEKPQVGLRLPSEAEWEYACRGGTESRFFFGDNKSQLRHYAWFNLNSNKRTHAVAEKRPNPFGLFDIYGNVAEWCEDHWHSSYKMAPRDQAPWLGPEAEKRRIRRGGCFIDSDDFLDSIFRGRYQSHQRHKGLGFRIARSIEIPTS